MTYKFIYDVPYVKEIVNYLAIPVIVIIIIGFAILAVYNKKEKNHEDPVYKYNVNILTLALSMIITVLFLSMLLGFSLALKGQMELYKFSSLICYLVLISPIVPGIYLIILISKLIKTVKNKPKKEEKNETNNDTNIGDDSNAETLEDDISDSEFENFNDNISDSSDSESADEPVVKITEEEKPIDNTEILTDEDEDN